MLPQLATPLGANSMMYTGFRAAAGSSSNMTLRTSRRRNSIRGMSQ